jgi:bacillithiol system protein YtxJ
MGLFDKIIGSKKETKIKISWISLVSEDQLSTIQHAQDKVVVLLKHSTRCGISNSVLRQFESKNEALNGQVDFYLLDLLNYRSLSAAIAEKFEVVHQSPQLLVFQNGVLRTHDSHHDIMNIDIESYLKNSI